MGSTNPKTRDPQDAQEWPYSRNDFPRQRRALMIHPAWILVPWSVFALALVLKVWQFGKALKRHLIGTTPSTVQFRQSLERIWEQEQGS